MVCKRNNEFKRTSRSKEVIEFKRTNRCKGIKEFKRTNRCKGTKGFKRTNKSKEINELIKETKRSSKQGKDSNSKKIWSLSRLPACSSSGKGKFHPNTMKLTTCSQTYSAFTYLTKRLALGRKYRNLEPYSRPINPHQRSVISFLPFLNISSNLSWTSYSTTHKTEKKKKVQSSRSPRLSSSHSIESVGDPVGKE